MSARIARLLAIAGGYCLACLVSAYSFGIVLFIPAIVAMLLKGDLAYAVMLSWSLVVYLVLLALYAFMAVAVVALIPATLAITYAEVKRLRSARYYGCVGAIIANVCFVVFQLARGHLRIPDLSLTPDRLAGAALIVLYLGVVGLIGGLVYWLTAGRAAGDWRVPQRTQL